MSAPSFSAASLLLLLCLPGFTGAVCPECLEFFGHLHWCSQPMTGTDTTGNIEATSLGTPDWLPNPAVFSPLASIVQQSGGEATYAKSQSAVCDICGLKFKNTRGVVIHKGRKHQTHASHLPTTSSLTTHTDSPSLHLHKQVAAGGRGLGKEQELLPDKIKNITSSCITALSVRLLSSLQRLRRAEESSAQLFCL